MNAKGFTLIETTIIVAIISILASIAAPSFVSTINATKARKTTDFVTQLVNFAKSDALNKNETRYMSVANGSICISKISQKIVGNDCLITNQNTIRNDTIQAGTTVTIGGTQEIEFDGIYGLPKATLNITVVSAATTKTIELNILGFVKVI